VSSQSQNILYFLDTPALVHRRTNPKIVVSDGYDRYDLNARGRGKGGGWLPKRSKLDKEGGPKSRILVRRL